MDPQTGNLFVLIYGVGVQPCDVFIRVQKFPRTTRQTDIKSKIPTYNWVNGQTYTLY